MPSRAMHQFSTRNGGLFSCGCPPVLGNTMPGFITTLAVALYDASDAVKPGNAPDGFLAVASVAPATA